jgi:hypothetical protein
MSKHRKVLGWASRSMKEWSEGSRRRRSHGNLRYSTEKMDRFVNGEAVNVMQVGSDISEACWKLLPKSWVQLEPDCQRESVAMHCNRDQMFDLGDCRYHCPWPILKRSCKLCHQYTSLPGIPLLCCLSGLVRRCTGTSRW